MKIFLEIFIVLVFVELCQSYKILVYAPRMGHSHVNFLGKIADTLVIAGHDVVFYLPEYDPDVKTNGSKLARLMHRKRDFVFPKSRKRLAEVAWSKKGESVAEVFAMISRITDVQSTLCERQLQDTALLEMLKTENFDLGISEIVSFCGIALFEKIGIRNYISAFAVNLMEGITEQFGISNNPSFVPKEKCAFVTAVSGLFSPSSDTMSYFERIQNLASYLVTRYIIEFITKTKSLKPMYKYISPDFDFAEVTSRSAFVFVNADEFLEFPRPLNHKIVYVGGIAVPRPEPLTEDYMEIMNSAKDGAVLISFGSVAKSYLMSNETKAAFIETFKKYPSVNFIWKYEIDDDIAANLSNVFKKKWVPQNDLLHHPKMRGFVSHGGANSLTESVYAGVPIICVPLFGDQMRNAKIVEKRGVGIIVDKQRLDSGVLLAAFKTLLFSKKHIEMARRLAEMIAKKPISAQDRVVKYTEFAAEFGAVANLDCAAGKLNFFQYYLLDIIVPFISVLLFLFLFFLKLFFRMLRRSLRVGKNKLD